MPIQLVLIRGAFERKINGLELHTALFVLVIDCRVLCMRPCAPTLPLHVRDQRSFAVYTKTEEEKSHWVSLLKVCRPSTDDSNRHASLCNSRM